MAKSKKPSHRRLSTKYAKIVAVYLAIVALLVAGWFWFWGSWFLQPPSYKEFEAFKREEITGASQKAGQNVQKAIDLFNLPSGDIKARSTADQCYQDSRSAGAHVYAYDKTCTQRQIIALTVDGDAYVAMLWLEGKLTAIGLRSPYKTSTTEIPTSNCYDGQTFDIESSSANGFRQTGVGELYFTIVPTNTKSCGAGYALRQDDILSDKSRYSTYTINQIVRFDVDVLHKKAADTGKQAIILLAFDTEYFREALKSEKP